MSRLKDANGNTIYVDNRVFNTYISNATIRTALDDTFATLNSDPEIEELEISDQHNNPLVKVTRSEFPELVIHPEQVEKTELDKDKVSLYIVKPSFDRKLKWQFLFQGNWLETLVGAGLDRGQSPKARRRLVRATPFL